MSGTDRTIGSLRTTTALMYSVSLLAVGMSLRTVSRRYTLDTVERRRRAQVFDRLARATVDDLAAGRLLTSIGLNDQDVCCAVIAEDDDAEGLAADLAATLPDALVRRVGDVVHVAVPASVDLRQALGRIATRPANGHRHQRAPRRPRGLSPPGHFGACREPIEQRSGRGNRCGQ